MIDWDDLLEGYNRIYGTNFNTPQKMVEVLYSKEETLLKAGDILGVAGVTVGTYMKKNGLPRLAKGHRGNSALQVAYRTTENSKRYTTHALAKIIGCSGGYINYLRNRPNKSLE
jgi:hypothetical protein